MNETIQQRVANGVKFLDKNVPLWRTKIDIETLSINSMSSCILGQIYRHWDIGTGNLGLSEDVATSYGFYPQPYRLDNGWINSLRMGEDGNALTDEWKRILQG